MSKMNEYPSVGDPQEFTQAEKAAFLGSAMCIATGTKNSATVTANIPFSDIRPTKLSDLTDDITVDDYDATSEAPISGKGVAAALGNFGGFQVVSLTSGANPVPDVASPSNKLIYLTKETSAKKDPYTEWIYTGNPTSALDVSKWEVIGETTVDLSDYYTKGQTDTAISNALDSIAPEQNSVLYGGGSGGVNKPMDVRYDNTLTKVSGANGYELKVAVPVPAPGTNAHRGEVLTVNSSDEAVWLAPAGGVPDPSGVTNGYVLTANNGAAGWAPAAGGGGGNPYTKVTVTPGDSYDSGRGSSTAEGYPYDGYTLYDQEVNITNNTYSILSTTIGYYPEYYDEGHEYDSDYWHPSHALDTLIINLDANTEFPMAVVEFDVDSDADASVNKIKVKVGNRILTRMYDAPFYDNFPLLNSNSIEFEQFDEHAATQWMPKYWEMGQLNYYNKSNSYFAFTSSSRVQVHIFGNCFRVSANQSCGIPAAS